VVRRKQTATVLGVLLAASMTLSRSTPAKDEKKGPPGHQPAAAADTRAQAENPHEREKPGNAQEPHGSKGPGESKGPPGESKGPHGEGKGPPGESKGPHGESKGDPAAAAGGDEHGARRAQRAEFKSAVAELRERQAQGKLTKEELKKELAALDGSRGDRRGRHRQVLKERWGGELTRPSALEELRHHERRMAQLERMSLLAQTERSGAAKDQLVTRIDKLIARENERHERKMSQLAAPAGNTQPASALEQNPAAKRAPGDKNPADKGATP
jgi:hypothetical protein